MQLGALLPLGDIGGDPAVVREYAQSAEGIGYDFVEAPDHVLGASEASAPEPGRTGAGLYHDPFVLFGYLAGCTQKLGFSTGVLILPQRQTVLVAKQAAQIDLLTKGRLRFGAGLGWNHVEYASMGKNFKNRAKRFEEQLTLLRLLWSEKSVTFEGEYDQVKGIGLCPRPIQRPIPIWLGGNSEGAYRRAGRLGDGWIPDNVRPGPDLDRLTAWVKAGAADAGRDYNAMGMQGRVKLGHDDEIHLSLDDMLREADQWIEEGCTHIAMNTMYSGLPNLDAHMDYLVKVSERLGLKSR
jgi:probable F420-dependent oxidoreductase